MFTLRGAGFAKDTGVSRPNVQSDIGVEVVVIGVKLGLVLGSIESETGSGCWGFERSDGTGSMFSLASTGIGLTLPGNPEKSISSILND